MSSIVAVDFGGTNIRVAYFGPDPHPKQQIKRPTLAQEDPERVIQRLKDAIAELLPENIQDVRIGIAAPAPLDPGEGVIHSAANLPGWKNVPLSQELNQALGCPVFLGNDVNLAALGDYIMVLDWVLWT